MRYEYHPNAFAEFEEATRYYADQEQGLGERFIQAIESGFATVCEDPWRPRVFEREVRRYLVHVFPYAILYTVEPDHVLIVAVMHCSREPGYWRKRVK